MASEGTLPIASECPPRHHLNEQRTGKEDWPLVLKGCKKGASAQLGGRSVFVGLSLFCAKTEFLACPSSDSSLTKEFGSSKDISRHVGCFVQHTHGSTAVTLVVDLENLAQSLECKNHVSSMWDPRALKM